MSKSNVIACVLAWLYLILNLSVLGYDTVQNPDWLLRGQGTRMLWHKYDQKSASSVKTNERWIFLTLGSSLSRGKPRSESNCKVIFAQYRTCLIASCTLMHFFLNVCVFLRHQNEPNWCSKPILFLLNESIEGWSWLRWPVAVLILIPLICLLC